MCALARQAFYLAATLAALAAGSWVSVIVFRGSDEPPVPAVDVQQLSFSDLEGYSRRLSEWDGKVRLINFWATWCGPCRDEIPLLKQLQAERAREGLQVIGIAIDDEEAVSAYHKTARFNYPVLIGDMAGMAVLAHYGNPSGALPYTVVLDREGQVLYRKIGAYRAPELKALAAEIIRSR